MGRPLTFETVEDLERAIDNYFTGCDNDISIINGVPVKSPYTMSGLARALKVCRQTLLNYEMKGQFLGTIEDARGRCEEYAEKQLFIGKNPSGAVFALKNYGWTDKQELNVGGQYGDNPLKLESNLDTSQLSDDELEQLMGLIDVTTPRSD